MTFQAFLDEIEGGVREVLAGMGAGDAGFSVSPSRPGFGDASCNAAFLLAKRLGKGPGEVAREIAARYRGRAGPLVAGAEPHDSGYVNFRADWGRLCGLILRGSRLDGFGDVDLGGGSPVVVEHTSVNPNKALHIGHVRNIVVGDTVARILRKANYRVKVLNYVDDSGLQVADIVIGFRHLGFPEEPPDGKKFDHYCGDDVYVRTSARYVEDPGLEAVRKDTLKEIEDGGSETARFAGRVTGRVLACQLETCWNLGVTYDCLNFESQIVRSGLWRGVFERLKGMGLAELEEGGKNAGCWVIRGRDGEEDKVIVRSNGTATYIAKDIPYAAWKMGVLDDPFGYAPYERGQPGGRALWQTTLGGGGGPGGGATRFSGDRVITVIDSRQARLQKIIADLMSRFRPGGAYVHLGYESVTLSPDTARTLGLDTRGRQAQMSGRKGLYVNADSVYDLLKGRTAEETAGRHPGMGGAEVEEIAHQVSVGTLRYEMVRQDLDKVITFDLARSLSLEGDTASYMQYANARAARIMEKAGRAPPEDADFALLAEPAELGLVRGIGMFGMHVGDAARNLSPKVIARYCHGLAVSFNEFYEGVRVLGAGDAQLEDARLFLVGSFRATLGGALGLLGISAPDRM